MRVMRRLSDAAFLVYGVGSGDRNGRAGICYPGTLYCVQGNCLSGVPVCWTGALDLWENKFP